MNSSHWTGENSGMDPVESLRPLTAELQALVDRVELEDEDAALARSLHAARQQVAGPRAVVMLLGEREDLKRRFLERLLGPAILELPSPTAVCTWLEYGETAECTVTMPLGKAAVIPLAELEVFPGERAMLSIRLPNPTLQGGLALIDMPAAERGAPDERALDCIEHADAWIYVLGADHALSDQGAELLARLPDRGERLELVVEDTGTISGAERAEARERLIDTLKERCEIAAPRLTLVTPDATEGDEENVWHGRFATFHSVMMLRGREHRLEKTRTAVAEALSKVERALDRELAITLPGPRQARLRTGLKELEALASRFRGEEQPAEPSGQSSLGGIGSGANQPAGSHPPLNMLAEAMAAAMAPESAEAAELAAIQPRPSPEEDKEIIAESESGEAVLGPVKLPTSMEQAFGIARPASKAKPKRGVSVRFTGGLRPFLRESEFAWWRRAMGIALAILLLCLILWALSPRGFFSAREQPGEWEYHPPQPVPPANALTVDTDAPETEAGAPLPDAGEPGRPDLHGTALVKPSAAVRMPLAKPIPDDARAGAAPPRRHRHHLLGLGKLWHWIHPNRPRPADE